jgi:hypothetical protein
MTLVLTLYTIMFTIGVASLVLIYQRMNILIKKSNTLILEGNVMIEQLQKILDLKESESESRNDTNKAIRDYMNIISKDLKEENKGGGILG